MSAPSVTISEDRHSAAGGDTEEPPPAFLRRTLSGSIIRQFEVVSKDDFEVSNGAHVRWEGYSGLMDSLTAFEAQTRRMLKRHDFPPYCQKCFRDNKPMPFFLNFARRSVVSATIPMASSATSQATGCAGALLLRIPNVQAIVSDTKPGEPHSSGDGGATSIVDLNKTQSLPGSGPVTPMSSGIAPSPKHSAYRDMMALPAQIPGDAEGDHFGMSSTSMLTKSFTLRDSAAAAAGHHHHAPTTVPPPLIRQKDNFLEGSKLNDITNRFVVMFQLDSAHVVDDTSDGETSGTGGVIVTYSAHQVKGLLLLKHSFLNEEKSVDGARAVDVMVRIIHAALDLFQHSLKKLDAMAEEIEVNTEKYPFAAAIQALTLLQKQARVFKRCCQLNAAAIAAMEPFIGVSHRAGLVDRLVGFENHSDELAENAYNTINMMMMLDGYRSGVNTRIFTYTGFVLTPIALLTSWYGMNFTSIEEFQHPDAYTYVIIAAGCMAIVLIGYIWLFMRS